MGKIKKLIIPALVVGYGAIAILSYLLLPFWYAALTDLGLMVVVLVVGVVLHGKHDERSGAWDYIKKGGGFWE